MNRLRYLIFFITTAVLLGCGKNIAPSDSSDIKGKNIDSATFDYLFVEAVKLKLGGNGGEALRYLEECIKIKPESDAVYFEMAQILMSAGDINNAKKYARKALSLKPDNYWYLMFLASSYYRENKLDSAILFYEKATIKYPEKEEMQVSLANLYSENREYNKAVEIFDSLDEKYGINETTTLAAVKNMMLSGQYDNALKKIEALMLEFPDEFIYKGLLAEIYKGKGDNSKAEEIYSQLIEESPEDPDMQLSLCDFLLGQKNYEELFVLLNKVILNEKITRDQKVALFSEMIEADDILKGYLNRLSLSLMVLEASFPEDNLIMLLRPDMYIRAEQIENAKSRLEEIIKINKENYYAWEKLLFVYLDQKDYNNLEEKARIVSTNFNMSFIAKALYATAAMENENFNIALDELRKATILAGNDEDMIVQVLSLKAEIYYRMGNYEETFRTFDEALKVAKNDMTILNNYAYYLAEKNIRLKEAESMAEKVIEIEKSNSTFLDTYAWVLYKRSKFREAEKVMKKVMEFKKDEDAELYEHYGFILKERNNCKEAVKNWNIALKLDSTKKELIREIEKCRK